MGVIPIPDKMALEQLRALGYDKPAEPPPENPPVKRGRGRPKGSKNKHSIKPKITVIDPKTGIAINKTNAMSIMGKMGDDRVSDFVQYHIDMLQMRQGVNKKDVSDLYNRFFRYLAYCKEHNIVPNNMNCYFAIGLNRQDIARWRSGELGTPEQQQFARDLSQLFESIHEQGAIDGMFNPISAIFWQKAHDGMIEASKMEVVQTDPLGEKKSAEKITEQYADILPDD